MSLISAAILGFVQALTEFLPVSSTAHLLVFGELLGQSLEDPRFRAFVTIIQSGTTLAVLLYFRAELRRLAWAAARSLAVLKPLETADSRLAWFIALGTLPAAVLGKLFESYIESLGNLVIAGSLVFWGLVLLYAEKRARHVRTIGDINACDALGIGLGQALALVPGTSRSGSTITTGLLLGLTREDAARFSFLLSVPIILGAGAYKLKKALPDLGGDVSWRSATLVGTAVAAIVGFFVIGWLLRFLRTRTTYLFVVWRILAGIAIATLIWTGVLPSGESLHAAPSPPALVR